MRVNALRSGIDRGAAGRAKYTGSYAERGATATHGGILAIRIIIEMTTMTDDNIQFPEFDSRPDVLKAVQRTVRLAEEEDEEHLVCLFCGNEQIDTDRRVCGRCQDYKGVADVKICSLCGEDIYPTDEYCPCQDKPKEAKKEEP